MTLRLTGLLLGALCTPSRLLPAQDSLPAVDPRIATVVSGGRWDADGRNGYYRLVLRSRGENVPTDLTIEWLSNPSRGQGPTVVQTAKVKELSGDGRLDRPQISGFLKGWRVWVQQSDSGAPGGQVTRAIDLGPPGEFKVKPK